MNFLNLPAYRILDVRDTGHDYQVTVEVAHPPPSCEACRHADLVGFGRREEVILDAPVHGKRVGIHVQRQRYRCKRCGTTFYEQLPEKDEKRQATRRLVHFIEKQSLRHTFASIAEDTGLDEKTVRNIFRDYVNRLEATVRFETPRWMGIDEIHLIRRPRCVVSNIEHQTVVNLLPNRNKATVTAYLQGLANLDTVRYVAMDMWNPYRDAVTAVIPHATVIVDKFHVLRLANQALESVRKFVRTTLTPKRRRALVRDRFVLLKRPRELTDQDKLLLSGWAENFPAIKTAYELKEAFFDIYGAQTKGQALAAYAAWRRRLPPDMEPAFRPLAVAVENWKSEVFAYFDHRITNAYTESLNNLIRVMNRLGRGYSFEALRAKILFTEGVRKTRRPPYERRRDTDERVVLARYMTTTAGVEETESTSYGASISTLIRMIEAGRM